MKYVSLHHHSTFSYMDGFGMPAAHVARAVELGMSALALTEHGNVSSHVKLEQAAQRAGIKPIFGCEMYTAAELIQAKWHLTVLAADQQGYRNLNKLVSRAWAEGFYYWPTASGEMLATHSDGLIVLSGCSDSLLACTLLGGKANGPKREKASSWDVDEGERLVRKFKDLLGDRYYLECQQFPDLERTCTLNPIYEELARRTRVPLVGTADVHYPYPEDNEMQKILHAAGRGSGSVEAQEATWEYDIRLTFPQTDREIWENLCRTGLSINRAVQCIASSAEIAERCNVVLPKSERVSFPIPKGKTREQLIWDWLRDGWRFRHEENHSLRSRKSDYHQRLDYEMGLIVSKGYVDYFLMLSHLVRWAKARGIAVGPARGSAAASLACYLLRITEVDPMQFPTMMFERFIDATREDLPDVDLDFADDRRSEVWGEAARLFGADHVGSLGNFVHFRGKNSIQDVARVYRIPKYAAEQVAGALIERSGGDSRLDSTLADTVEIFPQAKAMFEKFPELEYATRLEGNLRGFSVHAAGIVISKDPINDTCAMYEREVGKNKNKVQVVAYDKKDSAYLGMLKADFLGLSNMGMISIALGLIGMKLEDLYRIPLDDPKTLEGFQRNDVVGVFQFEGRATRLVCREVKPDNFLELADINALSRPGPLFSGTKTRYVNVKHGYAEVERLHPLVDKVTTETKGQIIYQEQVLAIIREIGGFPVTKVADIRKIISQKLGEASFNAMVESFIEGAARLHGIKRELAQKIWNFLVTSATYSFNIAHSVSYSMLSFWNMWLKQHHPLAFYAASLRKVDQGKWKEKGPKLLRDAQRHGFRILPPDPERSGATWVPDGKDGLLAGFEQVPGIGATTARNMLHWRESFAPNVPLTWEDFTAVRGIGGKTMEKVAEFARDPDPFGLDLVGKVLRQFRADMAAQVGFWRGLPVPTHTSDEMIDIANGSRVVWIGVPKLVEYKDLIEDQRARFGLSEEEIRKKIKKSHLQKWATVHAYDDGEEDVYLRFDRFAFPRFATGLELLRPDADVVLIIGEKKKGFGNSVQVKKMLIIDPDDEGEDDDAG